MIVPVYKVEKYIHRCVDSILNQTYTNLEIILVNDGTPDTCGEIIDTYQKKDSRVKVIHKENGGLSDARNAGMKSVTGAFTMYVDSDDWLDHKMIKTMMEYANHYKADVVQSAFYYAYEDKLLLDHRHDTQREKPICLDKQALMFELVKNEKVKNFAWGKLYKTAIIKDIPFKKGVLFEDVFWAHQVMHQVDTYTITQQPFYYYFQRDDSIVATYTLKNLDMLKGLNERHRFIEKHYKELINESYQIILKTSLIHYHLLSKKIDKQGSHRKEIECYIQENLQTFKEAVKDNKNLKRQLLLFSIHPNLERLVQRIISGLERLKILSRPPGLKQVNL